MTIQAIAKKQIETSSIVYFARKGSSDCYWFAFGSLRSYSDTDQDGCRISLPVGDLAANDWRVIRRG